MYIHELINLFIVYCSCYSCKCYKTCIYFIVFVQTNGNVI